MSANSFKEVFIFVTGSSPQIVTETIQALAQQSPPLHPDEIHIVTTRVGKMKIEESLFEEVQNLADEWGLPVIPLNEDSVHVIKDDAGIELDDIRSERDNEIVGEVITRIVREATSDISTRLHCSLAGGRKTMSFYIGSILQLFGRPQDRLYHVLAPLELENSSDFFFKPKINRSIRGKSPSGDQIRVDTDDVEIELVSLPYVRLREKFDQIILDKLCYSDLVGVAQKVVITSKKQPKLNISLKKGTIFVNDLPVKLGEIEMMVYAFIARKKILGCVHPTKDFCADCADCYFTPDNYSKDDETIMQECYLGKWKTGEVKSPDKHWNSDNRITVNFNTHRSRINGIITSALQDVGLADFVVITPVKLRRKCYGLPLDKSNIRIISGE